MPPWILAGCVVLAGADWPQFRGPNGAGTPAVSPVLLGVDPARTAWQTSLPPGYSSPVVFADTVYVQSAAADGSTRTLHALAADTGQPRWSQSRSGQRGHTHNKNSLATGTPAADENGVYVVVWNGTELALVAYSHTGTERWTVEFGPFTSQHGPGISPVAHAGRVYVNLDQDGRAELLAVTAATGKREWTQSRKPFFASYTPPTVRSRPEGGTEIVATSTAGLAGYDAATGTLNWEWNWTFDKNPLRTVGVTLVQADTLIATSGDGGGNRSMVCIRPPRRPGESAELVWEKRRDAPYVPSPLGVGEHLYWMTDTGNAVCAEAATGKIIWNERALSRAVSSSPVLAGKTILAIAEDGQTVLFPATPAGFENQSESRLDARTIASPALAADRLFVRAGKTLFCWHLGEAKP